MSHSAPRSAYFVFDEMCHGPESPPIDEETPLGPGGDAIAPASLPSPVLTIVESQSRKMRSSCSWSCDSTTTIVAPSRPKTSSCDSCAGIEITDMDTVLREADLERLLHVRSTS